MFHDTHDARFTASVNILLAPRTLPPLSYTHTSTRLLLLLLLLLPEQTPHPAQHAVLLRVVGVVLARDLEDGRERGRVRVDAVADALGDLRFYPSGPVLGLVRDAERETRKGAGGEG